MSLIKNRAARSSDLTQFFWLQLAVHFSCRRTHMCYRAELCYLLYILTYYRAHIDVDFFLNLVYIYSPNIFVKVILNILKRFLAFLKCFHWKKILKLIPFRLRLLYSTSMCYRYKKRPVELWYTHWGKIFCEVTFEFLWFHRDRENFYFF